MIVAMTATSYYEVFHAGNHILTVHPLYKTSRGFISVDKNMEIYRIAVERFFNHNPPILRVRIPNDITPEMIAYAEGRISEKVSRHSNGVYEYSIYTPSMTAARLLEENEMKARLLSFDFLTNWRILYKSNWYESYRVWKEGYYAPKR